MTEDKLQAIKAQLAALPPAAWTPVAVWSDDGTINAVGPQRTNEDDAVRDAYFIAYAPANMAALLAHVDELQAKYTALLEQLEAEAVIQGAHRDTIDALNANLAAVPVDAIRESVNGPDVSCDCKNAVNAWLETQVQP